MLDASRVRAGVTRPLIGALLLTITACLSPALFAQEPMPAVEAFDREVEGLRKLMALPGMQVAVVHDGRTVFERAYGLADVEANRPMTTDHLMEIASITKTMTAVVMIQLVEERKISLDDRVVKYPFLRWYFPSRVNPDVRLRHVLSHTSQGVLGETFCYQGNRFGFVLGVFGAATPEQFLDGEAVTRRILQPLAMDHTLPRPGAKIDDAVRSRLAKTYGSYDPSNGAPIAVPGPHEPNDAFPAAGFYSNVGDLARFAVALDQRKLLSSESYRIMESPTINSLGKSLPYGIGWFTQSFDGMRLLWHYGYSDDSALFLRVPEKKLTLIVLANASNMSAGTRLGYGDVLNSPFAIAFLKHFVIPDKATLDSPNYEGPLDRIQARIISLDREAAHAIYFEELKTQAVVRELMSGPYHDSDKALGLFKIANEVRPALLPNAGLAELESISHWNAPTLQASAIALAERQLHANPAHPAVLTFASRILKRAGRTEESAALIKQLADSTFDDDELTLDACVATAERFAQTDPETARAYFWRAARIGFTSPRYPRAKVDQAIEKLNALDTR